MAALAVPVLAIEPNEVLILAANQVLHSLKMFLRLKKNREIQKTWSALACASLCLIVLSR